MQGSLVSHRADKNRVTTHILQREAIKPVGPVFVQLTVNSKPIDASPVDRNLLPYDQVNFKPKRWFTLTSTKPNSFSFFIKIVYEARISVRKMCLGYACRVSSASVINDSANIWTIGWINPYVHFMMYFSFLARR